MHPRPPQWQSMPGNPPPQMQGPPGAQKMGYNQPGMVNGTPGNAMNGIPTQNGYSPPNSMMGMSYPQQGMRPGGPPMKPGVSLPSSSLQWSILFS